MKQEIKKELTNDKPKNKKKQKNPKNVGDQEPKSEDQESQISKREMDKKMIKPFLLANHDLIENKDLIQEALKEKRCSLTFIEDFVIGEIPEWLKNMDVYVAALFDNDLTHVKRVLTVVREVKYIIFHIKGKVSEETYDNLKEISKKSINPVDISFYSNYTIEEKAEIVRQLVLRFNKVQYWTAADAPIRVL